MRVFLLLLMLAGFSIDGGAQDSLTIMHYNLLDYGNSFNDCNAQSNNANLKDTSFQRIIKYVQPDILTANEIVAGSFFDVRLMDSVLSQMQPAVYAKAPYTNASGGNFVNMLYYDSTKLTLRKHSAIATSFRDLDLYELAYRISGCQGADTLAFSVAVIHLPAGGGTASAQQTSTLINALDTFATTQYTMIAGDYNLSGSATTAYQNLINTSQGEPEMNDPIQQSGNWGNNASFASIHTQSAQTSSTSSNCAAPGGLDDRYDLILLSDSFMASSGTLSYLPNSYEAIGQDGNRFGQAINQPTNNSVPTAVAQSLQKASDHLPVSLSLSVDQNTTTSSITVSSDLTICQGDTVQLNASANSPVEWWPSNSLSCTNCQDPLAYPTTSKSYTVATTNANCPDTAKVTVTVSDSSILSVSADTTICQGDTIQLNANANSSVQWQPTSGLSCTNCSNPLAYPNGSSSYTVTSTSSNCPDTSLVNVTIDSSSSVLPYIADSILTTTIEANSGYNQYQWSTGDTGQTVDIDANGTYSVTATSANGCTDNDSVYASVSVGIRNTTLQSQIKIWPNPVSEHLTIRLPQEGNDGYGTMIRLVSSDGRLIREKKGHSATQQLAVSNLQAGLYFLEVQTAHRQCHKRVMIK